MISNVAPYIDRYDTELRMPMVLSMIGYSLINGGYSGSRIRTGLTTDLDCQGNGVLLNQLCKEYEVLFELGQVYPSGVTSLELEPNLTPESLYFVAQDFGKEAKLQLKCQGNKDNASVRLVDEIVIAIQKRLNLTSKFLSLNDQYYYGSY